jgi:hypothetical protein
MGETMSLLFKQLWNNLTSMTKALALDINTMD